MGNKKSFFSKIIDSIKTTALYDMFFNESAGMVIDSEQTDTMGQVESLAQVSGMTTAEIMSIEAAFNSARSNIKPLADRIQTIQQEQKNPVNLFSVNKKDLNHDLPKTKTKTQNTIEKAEEQEKGL